MVVDGIKASQITRCLLGNVSRLFLVSAKVPSLPRECRFYKYLVCIVLFPVLKDWRGERHKANKVLNSNVGIFYFDTSQVIRRSLPWILL